MTAQRTKVGFLTNIYAPYKEPLLAELATHVDLKVFYCAESEPNRSWAVNFSGAYEYELLPGRTVRIGNSFFHFNWGLLSALRTLQPAVLIVGGYSFPTVQYAPFLCSYLGIKSILWSGSTALEERYGERLSRMIKRALVSKYDGFVAYTRRAAQYLISLGAEPTRVSIAPVTVETGFFRRGLAVRRDIATRTLIRARYQLNEGDFVWLFVGQLIHRKGGDVLIDSLARLSEKHKLLMVGSGPKRDQWMQKADGLGCGDRVQWLGNLSQEDLTEIYAAADALVLPSRSDPSGNVINEAMATGLPVIASDRVGTDLIEQGKQGFIFESGSPSHLNEMMTRMSSKASALDSMSIAASERISLFSIEEEARQFRNAIAQVLDANSY
jgi:glycosyltransferase involved in cell wall biosynthesis